MIYLQLDSMVSQHHACNLCIKETLFWKKSRISQQPWSRNKIYLNKQSRDSRKSVRSIEEQLSRRTWLRWRRKIKSTICRRELKTLNIMKSCWFKTFKLSRNVPMRLYTVLKHLLRSLKKIRWGLSRKVSIDFKRSWEQRRKSLRLKWNIWWV